MKNSLSKNALLIQNILDSHSVPCRVLEFSSSTRTSADAATSAGCSFAKKIAPLTLRRKSDQLS